MLDNEEELKKALIDILKNGFVNNINNKSKKLFIYSEVTDNEKLQNMLIKMLQDKESKA